MNRMTGNFKPFANDSTADTVDELGIENGTTRILFTGELVVPRDRHGLALAKELKARVDAIVEALEAATDLPDSLPAEVKTGRQVDNPFSKKG